MKSREGQRDRRRRRAIGCLRRASIRRRSRSSTRNVSGCWSCARPRAIRIASRAAAAVGAARAVGVAAGARRAAACPPRPSVLFDAGFASAPRWLELRTRGVHELPQRDEPAYFPSRHGARSITRRMLVYGWHLARSRPRAACLVFGSTMAVVESLAACSLAVARGRRRAQRRSICARAGRTRSSFWRELLLAASAGADWRLHELLLGGIQRLAAETLAAHAP